MRDASVTGIWIRPEGIQEEKVHLDFVATHRDEVLGTSRSRWFIINLIFYTVQISLINDGPLFLKILLCPLFGKQDLGTGDSSYYKMNQMNRF